MSVLLLGGSPSPSSSSNRLLQHIGSRLALHGHRSATLHVRDLPGQALLHADADDPAVAAAMAQVRAATAVVVATPVYKASYAGILKAFLDTLPQDGLAGKLVLPLATGGSPAHTLVIDYALRPVLAALGAHSILPGIYATSGQLAWQDDGLLAPDSAVSPRLAAGIEQLSIALLARGNYRAADDPRERVRAAPVVLRENAPSGWTKQARNSM